jgi:aspartyl-tRNA(Asn)/glutamyl-tRNA(Gln) amidotransferase subunit A
MTSDDLVFTPAHEIGARVRRGELSALEVTEAHLARIERLQPRLNCFITVLAGQATEQSRAIDADVAAAKAVGPLAGVPVGIKDIIDVAGTSTTAGSHRRFHHQAVRDATVIARLRAAGAVVIGKTSLHEFAYGVTNNNPHYGPTRNAWDLTRIPGGSSGGSAVAVSAGLCAGAVGTDTGGSIRIPASLCGVVGIKPTYGRVPVDGIVPLSWSLDHAGPLTRTVRDAALFLDVMAGRTTGDAGAFSGAFGADTLEGVRIGIPRPFFWERLDPQVASLAGAAIESLRRLGGTIVECEVPYASFGGAVAAVVMSAEATAFHADRLRTHADAYGDDVRVRLDRGLFLSATDYVLGLRARRFLRREFTRAFDVADVLVMPTTQAVASPIEEDPETASGASLAVSVQLTRFTNPFNTTGLPALSMPCGFTRDGLPAGLQIVGPAGGEATVLRVGDAYERTARWTERRPPL